MKANLKRLFKVRNNRKTIIFCFALICALAVAVGFSPAAHAVEWYVDNGTVPNPRDGQEWGSAYATIQDALDDASFLSGDEIWVKAGTYTVGDTIIVSGNPKIYGGFVGTETTRNQRDWITNVTTLDGADLIDHVFFIDEPLTTATIDGFTITGGNAGVTLPTQAYDFNGGAICIRNIAATVSNCIFTENNAEERGGAIFNYNSGSTFVNNTFYDNTARNGAAIYNLGDPAATPPTVTNCLFYDNLAEDGGGIFNYNADAIITNCTFSKNGSFPVSLTSHGGGIYNYRSDAIITNSIFWGNSAHYGPQIFNYQYTELLTDDCTIGETVIQVYHNTELSVGDTIYITHDAGGAPVPPESAVIDVITDALTELSADYTTPAMTVDVNDASGYVAGDTIYIIEDDVLSEVNTIASVAGSTITLDAAFENSYTTANNAIVYKDIEITIDAAFTNDYLMGDGAYIYIEPLLTVTYSDVEGGNWDDRTPVWENNIEVNPNFVASSNYRLDAGSSCIDAGDNTELPDDLADLDHDLNTTEEVPYDLDGNPRRFDDTLVADTGNGTAPIVDMGAYEYFLSHTVTFVAGTGGNITGDLSQVVAHGSDCTEVEAVPDATNDFVNWTGGLTSTDNPLTVLNVTADMTINANFIIGQHTLTMATAGTGSGTVTPGAGNHIYNHGDVVPIEAVAATGSTFSGWTGSVADPGSATTTVTITAGMTVTANFTIDQHTLTMATGGTGSGTVTPTAGGHTYNYGDVVDIEAVTTTGSTFSSWTGSVAAPGSATTTVTITGDMTVTANFTINQHTLTMATGGTGSGTVTPTVGGHTYNYGDVVDIEAVAATGSTFSTWIGSVAVPGSATTSVTITGDMTVTANFTINQHTLTMATAGTGSGTVTPGAGGHTYNYGTVVDIEAVAATGSTFSSWTGSVAVPGSATTTVTITGDMFVTANFTINQYTVTFAAGANGGVTGTSPQTVDHGGNCTAVDAVPATDYRFLNWTGTGGFVSIDDPLTVTNVTSDMTITANFTRDEWSVTFLADTNGSVAGTSPQVVPNGTDCTPVTASAFPNHHFVNWTGTGGFVTTIDNPLTVTNVTSSMNITANFAIDQHTLTMMAAGGTGSGTITPTADDYDYDYGTVVDLNAVPGAGSVFDGWTGDVADPSSATTTVTMDSDKTVTATFNSDGDSDGISDTEEDGHPVHPISGITGDGNGDGVLDSTQDFVTSLLTQDGLDYVTIESAPGTILSNVSALENPSPSDSPSGLDFTQGFFNFTITGLAPGASTTVTLYCPAGAAPTTYYRYGPLVLGNPPEWYEFMDDGTTGAVINGSVITLDFVDGDRGDDDLTANGTIVDAGGPGSAAASSSSTPAAGGGSSGGGCFIATTTSGLSNITAVSMTPYLALMLLLLVVGKAAQGRRKR